MSRDEREWVNPDDSPDETPDGESADEAGAGPLSVQVDGGRGAPTRLLILSRSGGGLVEVREILPGCAPLEYTATPGELLALFERAQRDRRRVSASLYEIRLWLDG